MEVVGLNFSSATTPELLLKTFDHYCEYRKTPNGVVLAPVQVAKAQRLAAGVKSNRPQFPARKMARALLRRNQLARHGQLRHPKGDHVFAANRRTKGLLQGVRPNVGLNGADPVCWRLQPAN